MYVEYEYQCGNCKLHEDTSTSGKIYCEYYRSYYDVEDSCEHQERINKSSESATGCFITTLVCDLMGLKDDCDTLNSLRFFRNEIMQKDSKYIDILYEYDHVGPKIAKCLKEDHEKGNMELAQLLYNTYLIPTVELIKNKKYSEAVESYTKMTKSLEQYYGIEAEAHVPNGYDFTKGGHGKILIKE